MQEKLCYKAAFSQLRDLKGEIEHLQTLLEHSRQKLQKDFQQWLALIARQQQHQQPEVGQQQQVREDGGQLAIGNPGTSNNPNNTKNRSRPLSPLKVFRSNSSSGMLGRDAGSVTANQSSLASRPCLQKCPSSVNEGQVVHTGDVSTSRAMPSGSTMSILSQLNNRAVSATAASQDPGVDPQVLTAASPHLTGNAAADEDIIKFYEAKAKLLQMLGQQQ